MWTALGSCYKEVKDPHLAIHCFKKALLGNDGEVTLLYRIAELYESINQSEIGARYYNMGLEERKGEPFTLDDIQATSFLVNFLKDRLRFKEARVVLELILNTEEGKLLQGKLKSLEKVYFAEMETEKEKEKDDE